MFQAIEIELIKSMKRNLKRHQEWEKDEGFEWEQWQAVKLREIRKYRNQNERLLSGYTSKLPFNIKTNLLLQYLEAGSKVDKEVEKAIKKGFKWLQGTPSDDFFQGNNKKLDAFINALNNDLTTAQTAALKMMDDVYRRTVIKAESFLASGAKTYDQAIDMATKDFLSKGLTCITYSDGRNVNIASYSQMAVRTANKRVYLMGEGERRKEWGISTVLISKYLGCSPTCQPWQGRVYIDDVYSGGSVEDADYPLLSEAIEEGLFHPNCKHSQSTFFPGISNEPKPIEGDETKGYEEAKRKTEIERNIQKYKRLKEGSLDTENIKKYSAKIREWNNKLDVFKKLQNKPVNDKIKVAKEAINHGAFNTRIRKQKQLEHISGSMQWRKYFDKRVMSKSPNRPTMFDKKIDIESLVNKYMSTGMISFARKNDMYPREYCDAANNVGRYWDVKHQRYFRTNRFCIVYSGKGIHAYPVKPMRK